MADNSRVNWYANDVMMVVDEANDDLVTRLAFAVEGEAKVNVQSNGQIDTGFMVNAIYSITPLANRRGQAEGGARGSADRELAPEPALEKSGAIVHGAALYTIYQEMRQAFMYPALEKVKGQTGGMIREVGRQHFDD